MSQRLILPLLLALAAGCATPAARPPRAHAPRPPSPFPSREAVEQLVAAPLPAAPPAPMPEVEVAEWKTAGPFSASGEPAARVQTPWSEALARRPEVSGGAAEWAGELDCLSREVGRFYLEKKGLPSDRLARFLAARCGAYVEQLRFRLLEGEVPARVTEKQLFANARSGWEQTLQVGLQGGRGQLAGVWAGRAGRKAVAVLATARRTARFAPGALAVAADGSLAVKGELLSPAAAIHVMVNQGAHGVYLCEPEAGVAPPRFSVRCQTRREDADAWLEVVTHQRDRLLGRALVHALVSPAGTPSDTYREVTPLVRVEPAEAPAGTALDAAARGFAQALNAVRAQAGLAPLVLAEAQSRTAHQLAPRYFAAGEHRPVEADRVVLGLEAGWEVEGVVRSAAFASLQRPDIGGPGGMLASMMEMPFHRSVLLAPDVQQVAVGATPAGKGGLAGTVVSTYSLFTPSSLQGATDRLFGSLLAAREAHVPTPFRALREGQPVLEEALKRVHQGTLHPDDALQESMEWVARTYSRPVQGYRLEASALEEVTWPRELLRPDLVGVAMAVTYFRPPGEPWGRYVVLVVAAGTPGMTFAAGE